MYEPTSIHNHAANAAKLPVTLFLGSVLICILAIVDTFINDILPNKYQFKQAYNFRHVIYMALALISFSLSAGLLVTFGGSILVGRLWLDSLVATVVAVLDIFARHRRQ
jgi:divalent metal cation (Fe/Co/Zn/Cd) transporter